MKLHTNIKNKKGVVLMIVITTIVFLIVIVQQMGFDTHVEFQNGASHYHSLRAYHSAQSGLKLALLRIILYKKIQKKIKEQSTQISSILTPMSHSLWREPLYWPPILSEEEDSKLKKSEIQSIIDSSLFDKHTSYKTFIENEGAKLDLNDLSSPISRIRQWAKQVLLNLFINLREENSWISKEYSENELKEIVEKISLLFNPLSISAVTYYPPKTTLMSINDLLFVDGVSSELIEFLRPYITIFGEVGVNLQFIDKMIFKSLHRDITPKMIENIFNEKIDTLPDAKDRESFLQSQNFLNDAYFNKNSNSFSLSDFVFNNDTPQNFKITSYGYSSDISRGIEAIVYDPSVMERSLQLLNREYPLEDKAKLPENSDFSVSPFIIHWKDI